ncbi:MAG: ribonuclease Z [Thermostichales cyanobacterium SZTDM-1c_bins_54]
MSQATDLRLTFLGTSSGIPTRHRNVSGVAVQLPQRSELWLLDCGEATQHQIIRHPDLNISQVRRIWITHLHGDHIYGLPGLLATLGMSCPPSQVDLYGPPGLQEFLRAVLRHSDTHIQCPWQVHTVETGLVFSEAEYSVYAAPLDHRIPAFGYRIVEHDRPGSFNVAQAQADGIPPGPIYGRLKLGETVTLGDGRVVDGRRYVGPPIPGRKIAYCTDTIFCQNAIDLARGTDVLIHEATYAESERPLAERAKHSTARMAAEVAARAKTQTLILTHFSPRYGKDGHLTLEDLQAEAQQIFPNTLLATDRFTYAIPRRAAPVSVPALP